MVRDLLLSRGVFSLLFVALALVVGCPPPPPSNQSPMADAGDQQTADGGEQVTLDGSGSSDPDGDSLSYEWTQIAGPSVTLEDASTAQASFRTPNEDTTLRFSLVVVDEAGVSSTDSVNVIINAVDNVPPVASAGDNRTARGGAFVALHGDGSFDDDGDALTYRWVQIDGAQVTLIDADTDSTGFTASNEDDVLVFELTVDDGNGHTDTDTVRVTVNREPPRLYVANFSEDSILRFDDPVTRDGNVVPDAILSDPQALLDGPIDLMVNRDNWLVVANRNSNALTVYLAVQASSDDVAPYFVVQGNATLLDQPTSMAYDPDAGLVFVANTGTSNDILVFPGPSEVVFDGDLPPLRVISSDALSLPAAIALDENDRLYVANTGSNNILVFDNASGRDGDTFPDRIIGSDVFTDPLDVLVDDTDTLYVVDSSGTVFMFSNASTLDGNSTPTSTLTVRDAQRLVAVAMDAAGVGYLVDTEADAIYAFDEFSAVTGDRPPDRTISGDQTQLNRPTGVFLLDQ